MVKLDELMEEAREAIGAKRVFGTPYEKNGVTVIPAARIMGGLGAGEGPVPGTGNESAQIGSGGGYGLRGGPAGAFVIKGDSVTWLPAVDVNRLMLGFQVMAIILFLTVRSIFKARANAEIARYNRPEA